MATPYTKPHLSYAGQVALMESRGLVCTDLDRALAVLRAAGYYRFSAYVYPFREPLRKDEQATSPYHFRSDRIRPGTTFEQIEALWRFDRLLRMIVLDGLETIEVGIRTQVAHVLGGRNAFGHLDRSALNEDACREMAGPPHRSVEAFEGWSDHYEKLRSNALSEDFVRHNVHKYGGQLPVWIAIEFLDFGAIARLFKLLKADDQNAIARDLGIRNGNLLARILPVLNYVRNSAAHHARLWNRTLTLKVPKFPEAVVPATLAHVATLRSRDKIYTPLAVAAHMTDALDPRSNWPSRLRTVVKKFPQLPGVAMEADMGFPAGWQEMTLWKSFERR
jgi:abortive infection bacteriophage resistance protein